MTSRPSLWPSESIRTEIEVIAVVGDIHGCIAEFDALVAKIGYRQGRDSLFLVGDLLDRGPAPVEVVARAMSLGACAVRGNHEDKALRWLAYERQAAAEPGFQNPMEPAPRPPRAPRPPSLSGSRPLSAEALELRRRRQEARAA